MALQETAERAEAEQYRAWDSARRERAHLTRERRLLLAATKRVLRTADWCALKAIREGIAKARGGEGK